MARHRQIHLVGGLEGGLIPARKGATRVGVLELRRGDGVRGSRRVVERRAVEAVQLVVQDARKGYFNGCGAARQCVIEGERGRFVRLVKGRLGRAAGGAIGTHRCGAEGQLDGVQGEGGRCFVDDYVNLDPPGKGGGVEIRGQKDAVRRRYDVAIEAVGVGNRTHKSPP